MKLAAFNATCPFEIGDKIKERRRIHPAGLNFGNIPVYTDIEHTITDIMCVHYIKSGKIVFTYELDNGGEFVQLEPDQR